MTINVPPGVDVYSIPIVTSGELTVAHCNIARTMPGGAGPADRTHHICQYHDVVLEWDVKKADGVTVNVCTGKGKKGKAAITAAQLEEIATKFAKLAEGSPPHSGYSIALGELGKLSENVSQVEQIQAQVSAMTPAEYQALVTNIPVGTSGKPIVIPTVSKWTGFKPPKPIATGDIVTASEFNEKIKDVEPLIKIMGVDMAKETLGVVHDQMVAALAKKLDHDMVEVTGIGDTSHKFIPGPFLAHEVGGHELTSEDLNAAIAKLGGAGTSVTLKGVFDDVGPGFLTQESPDYFTGTLKNDEPVTVTVNTLQVKASPFGHGPGESPW